MSFKHNKIFFVYKERISRLWLKHINLNYTWTTRIKSTYQCRQALTSYQHWNGKSITNFIKNHTSRTLYPYSKNIFYLNYSYIDEHSGCNCQLVYNVEIHWRPPKPLSSCYNVLKNLLTRANVCCKLLLVIEQPSHWPLHLPPLGETVLLHTIKASIWF